MSLHDPDKCACASTDKLCADCVAYYHHAVWKYDAPVSVPLEAMNRRSRRDLRRSKPR